MSRTFLDFLTEQRTAAAQAVLSVNQLDWILWPQLAGVQSELARTVAVLDLLIKAEAKRAGLLPKDKP